MKFSNLLTCFAGLSLFGRSRLLLANLSTLASVSLVNAVSSSILLAIFRFVSLSDTELVDRLVVPLTLLCKAKYCNKIWGKITWHSRIDLHKSNSNKINKLYLILLDLELFDNFYRTSKWYFFIMGAYWFSFAIYATENNN